MSQLLAKDAFLTVVRDTPLVSIDLVVKDAEGKILLGYRKNSPAKGYWFVPGGRICKNETLDQAFARITLTELGIALKRETAILLGLYDHIYTDNFANVEGIGTHYVVMAYAVELSTAALSLPKEQHSDYTWMSATELTQHAYVHPNTQAYV
ncbi:GDP-mannose mannosyl hydrolase [Agitococcus lubricus]|uniref:Colanic acid biosynthesis protein WcaH n=1 Tax=Agitococcus lubricus TaxID=1077255 RepID=A0A2T5J0B3_9GAMM|nr:GDP-mannose mannosyl hydrolase [Agitococcus lubricus]PTQ89767.1 colanic acid biosynthesis protein WcaH [Agitococcus lubricus]